MLTLVLRQVYNCHAHPAYAGRVFYCHSSLGRCIPRAPGPRPNGCRRSTQIQHSWLLRPMDRVSPPILLTVSPRSWGCSPREKGDSCGPYPVPSIALSGASSGGASRRLRAQRRSCYLARCVVTIISRSWGHDRLQWRGVREFPSRRPGLLRPVAQGIRESLVARLSRFSLIVSLLLAAGGFLGGPGPLVNAGGLFCSLAVRMWPSASAAAPFLASRTGSTTCNQRGCRRPKQCPTSLPAG